MTRLITADEAQALLDGATKGSWSAEPYGVVAAMPDSRNTQVACAFGRAENSDERRDVGALRDANARLLAAAPDLAATVVAQAADLARLRAAVRELASAEAAHDAALAGSDHDEWAFATRMAPINARVEAARAALDALTRESDGGDRG